MQPTSVFATAVSRLHADLILIRLKRAGIPRDKLSAIFPEGLTPNCALCWLDGHSKTGHQEVDPLMIAGPLHRQIRTATDEGIIRGLQRLGLDETAASNYVDHLGRGQILICVQTDEEPEVAIAWHTFRQLEAEGIALGLTRPTRAKSRWEAASEALPTGLAFGVAV